MGFPDILSWSIMPINLVAKAWTDPNFLTALLATPNTIIQNQFYSVPNAYNFIINQDTATTRYLTLPYLEKPYTLWTQDQVNAKLMYETGGDISLSLFLPAVVSSKAFYDPTYKSTLLSSANSALSTAGTTAPAGVTFNVNANSSVNRYITLPFLPPDWAGQTYDIVYQRLLFMASQNPSF